MTTTPYERWDLCWYKIQECVRNGEMKRAVSLLAWARNLAVEISAYEFDQQELQDEKEIK